MCVSPKKIINRSNHWHENMPVYLYVPCGHCHECLTQSRNDWFIRSFMEWHSSAATYFYTLTYNEDHLPHCNGLPCFSRRDIQLFIKRLRRRLDMDCVKLKYFVSSEYGEETHRPHYHVLLFLDKSFYNVFLFRRLVEDCWSESIRDSFGFVKHVSRGFVMQGKLNGGLVTNDAGIGYVTKYVTKDFEYMECCELLGLCDSFVSRLNNLYSFCSLRFGYDSNVIFKRCNFSVLPYDLRTGKRYEYPEKVLKFVHWFNRRFRQCSNFHLQSQNFGTSNFDFSSLDSVTEMLNIVRSDGQVHSYHLPRYFAKKWWYDVVENEKDFKKTRFVLSDEGVNHVIERTNANRKRISERLNSYLSFDFNMTSDFLGLLNSAFPSNRGFAFESACDVRNILRKIRETLDLDVMAIYSSVFRDRICTISFSELYLSDDFVKDNFMDILRYQLTDVASFDFGKLYELNVKRIISDELQNLILYNNHPYFVPYEFALTLLSTISVFVRSQDSKFKIEQERYDRNLKETLRGSSSDLKFSKNQLQRKKQYDIAEKYVSHWDSIIK